jgi:hypothetical protein
MFSKASTKAKNRRVKLILPFIIIIVIILVLVSKNKGGGGGFRKPWWSWTKFTGYPSSKQPRKWRKRWFWRRIFWWRIWRQAVDSVVDLAAEASGGGSVEVGNRLCKHSITKKSCKLQLFFFYLSMSLLAKNTSFIFIPVNFYYPPVEFHF